MKKILRFLLEGHKHYNFMESTVSQGLQALGHVVYGAHRSAENYCVPHDGEPYDVFLQCIDHVKTTIPPGVPSVFIWGDDSGTGKTPSHYPNFSKIDAKAIFVRDYRGGSESNVFPLNFGIEARYYCAHEGKPKPLVDRQYDVTFWGHLTTNPNRQRFLSEIRDRLVDLGYNVLIGPRQYEAMDGYWSQWVKGYCTHDPEYYKVLADSKILLSPMGAGPDCARHWEAMASGGIPVIERMPTVQVLPGLTEGTDCFMFSSMDEAITSIQLVMGNVESYQRMADDAFVRGRLHHTTKARALYMIDVMHRLKII
jgi:hypothetical protein